MTSSKKSILYPIAMGLGLVNILFAQSMPDSAPEESRFQKIELAGNLNEPLELAVLPNGNVLWIERIGAIKLYSTRQNEVKLIHTLPVFHDLEDGLLGLALDPDFARQPYVYLYYSPVGKMPVQRVSRFLMVGDSLSLASEKVVLEIPTQREQCCHSAGSLAFGPDKTLYIAVGDNTNPHNPGYYNSIDEQPGREYWDAQRTAANTHDFRGKILRIKPLMDTTSVDTDGAAYSIPEGNLFPKDGSKGKPEIYAMGCRNPYRIHVDQKTGYLYWGDVGQNTENNPARGPVSYDEYHQAKGPGFFGWPYFAGDNQPYADFDFARNKIGPFFDPQHPVNDSPNNTGSRELPPAQSALIWYSYDESRVFKNLGTGGKSPIAGPVYYADAYTTPPAWVNTPRRFPDYYNGKWFIAEWMRDWINVVTLDKEGKLVDIARFMPSATFDHPIDLEFGPDGALYVLEYGTFWLAQNKNSRLVRIEYNPGNRAPVAVISADKTVGATPLTVKFSASGSYDHDKGDSLQYRWTFKASNRVKTGLNAQYRFQKPGTYQVLLRVTDNRGQSGTSRVEIQVGNEKPEIDLKITGNQSFYWPKKAVDYQVSVKDQEDGSLVDGKISPAAVLVTLDHVDMGTDLTLVAQNQQKAEQTYFHPGLELIHKNDCRSCHHAEETSVGPSYQKVAARYRDDPKAVEALANKIIKGGNGNWGEVAMSAHPQLKQEEASEIVKYILTLGKEAKNRMPVKGSFTPQASTEGSYLFTVTYRDKGGKTAHPQKVKKYFQLRNPKVKAITCDASRDVSKFNNSLVKFTRSDAYICFNNIDLTSLSQVSYSLSSRLSGKLELRLDAPTGPLVSEVAVEPNLQSRRPAEASAIDTFGAPVPAKLKSTSGKHDIYLVYKDGKASQANMWNSVDLDWITFH